MQWKNTQNGRMAIYYMSGYLVNSCQENAFILNTDAKITDVDKIIDFLRRLIITEWVGEK